MAREVHFDIEGSPRWLTRVTASGAFEGIPEPGNYNFVVRAYITENGISSYVSVRRVEGVVQFQTPVWLTPQRLPAMFSNVPGTSQLQAVSYAAQVVYTLINTSPDAVLSQGGLLSYNLRSAGDNTFTVKATATPSGNAMPGVDALERPVRTRDFVVWCLSTQDARAPPALVSDLAQSAWEQTGHTVSFSSPQQEINQYCDTVVVVYAVSSASLSPDVTGELRFDGTRVLSHVCDATQKHTITYGTTQSKTVVQLTAQHQGVIVIALFDRRRGTMFVRTITSLNGTPTVVQHPERLSTAPMEWTSVAWVDGAYGVGSTFVTAAQDPRVDTIVQSLRWPLQWPLATDLGGAVIGRNFSNTFVFAGRTFRIASTAVPGLSGVGTNVVSGVPTTLGSYVMRVIATEDSTQLYTTQSVKLDAVRLEWQKSATEALRRVRVDDDVTETFDLVKSLAATITPSITPADPRTLQSLYSGASGSQYDTFSKRTSQAAPVFQEGADGVIYARFSSASSMRLDGQPDRQISPQYTQVVRLRADSSTGTSTVMVSGDNAAIQQEIQLVAMKVTVRAKFSGDASWYQITGPTVGANTWVTVEVVHTSTDMSLYLDQAFIGSTPHNTGSTASLNASHTIGTNKTGLAPFGGDISHIRYYTRALSAPEIAQISLAAATPIMRATITNDRVTFRGSPIATGTIRLSVSAVANVRSLPVTVEAETSVRVANKLPEWILPSTADVRVNYVGARVTIALDSRAPQPISYALPAGGRTVTGAALSGSSLVAHLPSDGAHTVDVDAVVDYETSTRQPVYLHSYTKTEQRLPVTITSLCEASLRLASSSPVSARVTHMTAYPASGPLYRYGVYLVYIVDTPPSSSLSLVCGSVSLLSHSSAANGSLSVTISGATQTSVPVNEKRYAAFVSIVGNIVRVRVQNLDISAPVASASPESVSSITFAFTGSALVGDVHSVPIFDPTFDVVTTYKLQDPNFVQTTAYVHTLEQAQIPSVLSNAFGMTYTGQQVTSATSVNVSSGVITTTVPSDGPAYAVIRATRADSTYRDGTIAIHGLTLRWPTPLQLGVSRVGVAQLFPFAVTSEFTVSLRLTDSHQGEVVLANTIGQSGQLQITASVIGTLMFVVEATAKTVVRTRSASVFVKHVIPAWQHPLDHDMTAFASHAFYHYRALAVSTSSIRYALDSVTPVRAEDQVAIDAQTGVVTGRVSGETVIAVQAYAVDQEKALDPYQVKVHAYNAGDTGSSAALPDAPPIQDRLSDVMSMYSYDTLAGQVRPDPLVFYPITENTLLRAGGVIVYAVRLGASTQTGSVSLQPHALIGSIRHESAPGVGIRTTLGTGQTSTLSCTVKADTFTAVFVASWDAYGCVQVFAGNARAPLVQKLPGADPVPDIQARSISFMTEDNGKQVAVGSSIVSTFPESARWENWRTFAA